MPVEQAWVLLVPSTDVVSKTVLVRQGHDMRVLACVEVQDVESVLSAEIVSKTCQRCASRLWYTVVYHKDTVRCSFGMTTCKKVRNVNETIITME